MSNETRQISLCEVLDRVLNKGVVVAAEATISVADVDLVYLGLQAILTSIETGRRAGVLYPTELRGKNENQGGVAHGVV